MTEIPLVVDPTMEAMRHLKSRFPQAMVVRRIPEGWDFTKSQPLVIVTATGGSGLKDVILDDTQIVIDVITPKFETSSTLSRQMYGVFQNWLYEQSNVLHVSTIKRPFEYPHTETRNPTYTFIVAVRFTASTQTL